MSYEAPGLNKARVARNSRAYRARMRASATCHDCGVDLAAVADCTCIIRPAARPLRKRSVKGRP